MVTKELIQNKLKHLSKLVEKTEPTEVDNDLFTSGQMDCYSMMVMVDEEWDKLNREEIKELMIRANEIWRERKFIENGQVDSLEDAKHRGEIVDFLMKDQKINAIKVYKRHSNKTLRESKDYVDAIQKVMIQEGRLPKIN